MIKSMTGYGRSIRVFENRELTVEIRSVNNRFLDCSVKLPRSYSFAEEAVKKAVKQSVSRGKVDVSVTVRSTEGDGAKIKLNRDAVKGYLEAIDTLSEEFSVKNDITASSLISLPDFFILERQETEESRALAELMEVVEAALAAHDSMRTVEGEAMERDLRSRSKVILDYVTEIEKRSPETLEAYRNRLREKMNEVLGSTGIDESRILAEAAIYADKIAVDEETVRLRSHFSQMSNMLEAGGVVGRNLDFLLQEMNREANTIGSKCNDLEQTRNVVAIKAELEKIREQVQNIE